MSSLLVLALALAMDSVAVAASQGAVYAMRVPTTLALAALFGAVQGGLSAFGWLVGSTFSEMIYAVDHWIGLIILSALGLRMIFEGIRRDTEAPKTILSLRGAIIAAFATSIDAGAAGVTLPLTGQPLLASVAVIAATTFLLSFLGVRAGSLLGRRFGASAEVIGGVVLVWMGVRLFVQHHF